MKKLLISTAIIELLAGAAIICCPSEMTKLLLGAALDMPVARSLARIAGVAITTLGTANWFAQYDANSSSTRGLITAMAFYNFTVALILVYSGLHTVSAGKAQWPAAVVHATMCIWCLASLLRKPPIAN